MEGCLIRLSLSSDFWPRILSDFGVVPQKSVCDVFDPDNKGDIGHIVYYPFGQIEHTFMFWSVLDTQCLEIRYYQPEETLLIVQSDICLCETDVPPVQRQFWTDVGGEISCHGDWRAKVPCSPSEFEELKEKIDYHFSALYA